MTVAIHDLEFVRGDTFERKTFVMSDVDEQHIDFTGYEPQAQVRVSPAADELLMEFTTGIDESGDPYIEASAATTATTGLITKAFWDLQMTDPEGKVGTYLGGSVTITLDVTRGA